MEGVIQWKDKAMLKLSHIFSFRSLLFTCSQGSNKKKRKSSPSSDCSIRSSSSSNVKCDGSTNEDLIRSTSDQLNGKKSMPLLTEDSSLITLKLYELLLSSLPNIVMGCQWALLYSTVKHGISLRTLVRRSSNLSGPCLLIVGDKQGVVFGGLLECPLKPTPRRKYQGTIQTFVFTTLYGEPRIFRPTGANRYFYMCMNDLLAFGGGSFALRLDEDLLNGTSGPCETFENECLAESPEFDVKNVELWGFTHSSQYFK